MQFQVRPKLHACPTCLSVVVEPPTILVVPLSDPSSWAFQVCFTEFSRASSSQKTQTHKNSQKPKLTKLWSPNLQTLTYRDLLPNQLVGFQCRCHSLAKIENENLSKKQGAVKHLIWILYRVDKRGREFKMCEAEKELWRKKLSSSTTDTIPRYEGKNNQITKAIIDHSWQSWSIAKR